MYSAYWLLVELIPKSLDHGLPVDVQDLLPFGTGMPKTLIAMLQLSQQRW